MKNEKLQLKNRKVIEEIIKDFRKTNLYNNKFLKDLKSGLKKSSYSVLK